MANRRDYTVGISKIAINPDRFGHLHPVIWFSTIIHESRSYNRAELPRLEDLISRNYAVGDLIQLTVIDTRLVIGSVTTVVDTRLMLGPVVTYAPDAVRWPIALETNYCHHCQQKLSVRNGNLCCVGENCPQTVFARLLYARQPDVLDIPLCRSQLNYMIWGVELVNNLPSLLFLEPEHLEGPHYDRTESESIVSGLRLRTDQLFGHDCSLAVQQRTQSRMLKALSLEGLYEQDRMRLNDQLYLGAWDWSNLPEVLTDAKALMGYGIAKPDARTIVQRARERVTELDGLTREF